MGGVGIDRAGVYAVHRAPRCIAPARLVLEIFTPDFRARAALRLFPTADLAPFMNFHPGIVATIRRSFGPFPARIPGPTGLRDR